MVGYVYGLPGGSVVKNPPANAGDVDLIRESGRFPGEEMATHSSILAWEIPWIEEPGGLQSMGSQRVRQVLVTKQQQDVCRLYANTMPFYTGDLDIHGIWYPWGSPGINAPRILRDDCILFAVISSD